MRVNVHALWLLTIALLLGFPLVSFYYWGGVLRSGTLPADADSVMIPAMGSIGLAIFASPVIVGITWLCARRYNPATRWTAWRADRPWRSRLVSIGFCGFAAMLLALLIAGGAGPLEPYEYSWIAYGALWLPWLLGLRAALIEQRGADELY